jgi:hypothetical protein
MERTGDVLILYPDDHLHGLQGARLGRRKDCFDVPAACEELILRAWLTRHDSARPASKGSCNSLANCLLFHAEERDEQGARGGEAWPRAEWDDGRKLRRACREKLNVESSVRKSDPIQERFLCQEGKTFAAEDPLARRDGTKNRFDPDGHLGVVHGRFNGYRELVLVAEDLRLALWQGALWSRILLGNSIRRRRGHSHRAKWRKGKEIRGGKSDQLRAQARPQLPDETPTVKMKVITWVFFVAACIP